MTFILLLGTMLSAASDWSTGSNDSQFSQSHSAESHNEFEESSHVKGSSNIASGLFLSQVPMGSPMMKPMGMKASRKERRLVLVSGVVTSDM